MVSLTQTNCQQSITTSNTSGTYWNQYVKEVKTEKTKFERFVLFRDLKITFIEVNEFGDTEITLMRGNKKFKLTINGKVSLEDDKGNILDEAGKFIDESIKPYGYIYPYTNNTFTSSVYNMGRMV